MVRVGVLELMMISAHTVYHVADVHVVLMLCTLLAGDALVYIFIYIYVCMCMYMYMCVCAHTVHPTTCVAVVHVVL